MALDLPTPGADAGTWGTKLNQALNGTGPGTLSATYATPATVDSKVDARTFLGSNFGFFGDSITLYGEGYPHYAEVLSQGAFRAAQIKSNPGNTSTVLLPLIDAQIVQADPKPTACLVLCGANDAQGSVALATYKANVTEMVTRLRAAGIAPVLGTVPPNDNDTYDGFVRTYNAWLMRYAEVNRIPLVDFYSALIDQATGNWKTGYAQPDGLHPTNAANKVMGQLVYDTLKPLLTPRPYLLQPVAGSPNIITNSNFLVDTNIDGIADGLSATPATGFAYSLVSDAAGFKWQRVTLTGVTSQKQLGSAEYNTGWAVGDRLRFAARVRSGQDNATGQTTGICLQITCYTSAYGVTANFILTSSSGNMSRQVSGVAFKEFVIPANTAKIIWSWKVGPADGTYDVAQPTLYNLTQLGII